MRTIYILLLTFVVVFAAALSTPVYGQYYISLEQKDPSGVDIAPFQAELNTAAQKLCVLFDSLGFQNKFKVFSAGFYVPQEAYKGYGYPDAFDKLKARAALASDYYLLIGRESNSDGVFGRFWVDLKLPSDIFCNGLSGGTIMSNSVRWKMDDQYTLFDRNPSLYQRVEIEGINLLKEKITNLVSCCNQSNNLNCSNCPDDESIKRLLLEKNFSVSDIDSVIITAIVSKPINTENMGFTDLVDDISDISVWKSSFQWALNQGLENLLLSYPHSSKQGVVATSLDMCGTDLYEKIQNDYYESFDISIIEFIWIKRDSMGTITDKKFFYKKKFPDMDLQSGSIITEYDLFPLPCHPQIGWLVNSCNSNLLPPVSNSIADGTYVISKNNVDQKYYGYFFDKAMLKWVQGDVLQYDKPLSTDRPLADRDDLYNDCDDYSAFNYSEFALEMSGQDTRVLIADFERWTNNNAMAGLKDDLTKIVQHFYRKRGVDLTWECSDIFSKYIGSQVNIKNFVKYFQGLSYDWLKNRTNFDGFIVENWTNIENNLPKNIPSPGGSGIFNASAAIAIGGIQGWRVRITSLNKVPCGSTEYNRCYEVDIHLTLEDIFGAGTSDRDRGGPWYSQVPYLGDGRIPGLTQMWMLQHCRTTHGWAIDGYVPPPCFVPFNHFVNFSYKYKLCYQ
jgi:hypothetical protein